MPLYIHIWRDHKSTPIPTHRHMCTNGFSLFFLMSFFLSWTNFYSGMNSLHLFTVFEKTIFAFSYASSEAPFIRIPLPYKVGCKVNSFKVTAIFPAACISIRMWRKQYYLISATSVRQCFPLKAAQPNECDGDLQVTRFYVSVVFHTSSVFLFKTSLYKVMNAFLNTVWMWLQFS